MSLLDWIRGGTARDGADVNEIEVVRRITGALDQMDPDRARFLAAFAYLLGRVASADHAISDAETRAMERICFFSYRRDGVTGRMASLIWLG